MPCTQISQDDREKKNTKYRNWCIYLKFKMDDGGLEMQLSDRIVSCPAYERPCT